MSNLRLQHQEKLKIYTHKNHKNSYKSLFYFAPAQIFPVANAVFLLQHYTNTLKYFYIFRKYVFRAKSCSLPELGVVQHF